MSMRYFVQISYWNPSSHEMDWCIVSKENKETLGEENAMLFDSEEEARNWTRSDEASGWLPCTFIVKESIYDK